MLTRPSVPAVLRLLSHAVARPNAHEGNELVLAAQLLAMVARRTQLEPAYIESEVSVYRRVGEMVIAEGLGDVAAMRSALDELDRHSSKGTLAEQGIHAYARASEVLCLAIDATQASNGPAARATLDALLLREQNQAQIVADFSLAGR